MADEMERTIQSFGKQRENLMKWKLKQTLNCHFYGPMYGKQQKKSGITLHTKFFLE